MSKLGRMMTDNLSMMRGGNRRSDTLAKVVAMTAGSWKTMAATPQYHMDEGDAGTAPDFDQLESWVAHPARMPGASAIEDANHILANGAPLPDVQDRACDCFFIVDSCLTPVVSEPFSREARGVRAPWNVPLGSPEDSAAGQLVDRVLEQMRLRVACNASCFNRTCRVYAPAYRQVSVMSLQNLRALAHLGKHPEANPHVARPRDLDKAFELAYGDVRRAFVRFVDDPANEGRPFVLAGHSQGTMMLARLLQEEVETHPDRRRRFVHAYMAGMAVPMELFSSTLREIQPSEAADDTCSVSSWRTMALRHPDARTLKLATWYAGRGWQKTRGPYLANNPITWSAALDGETSHNAEYLGALWPTPANVDVRAVETAHLLPSGVALRLGHLLARCRGTLGLVIPELVDVDVGSLTARVDKDGLLRVPHLPAESLFGLAERDVLLYHDLDMALFHNNLQENAARRVRAWQDKRGRAEPAE